MRVFGTVLLVAWTLLLLYVFARAWTVPAVRRRVPRSALLAAAATLWIAFALPRALFHGAGGRAVQALELFGLSAMAMLFLTAVSLLAVDLATAGGRLLPGRAPALRGWALVAGGLLAAAALVQGTRPPALTRHEVRLSGLPTALDGTVIVALSDTHLGSLLDGDWLAARIGQIAAEKPALVVLLGDLVEGHGEREDDLLRTLGRIRAPLGVYAVTGNHEYHRGRGPALEALEQQGVRVLGDRWVEAAPGLYVAGVEDLTSRRREGRAGDHVGRAHALRPHARRAALAVRVSRPPRVPVSRGAPRSRRHDADREPRHRHLGPAPAPLATRGNPAGDPARRGLSRAPPASAGEGHAARLDRRAIGPKI